MLKLEPRPQPSAFWSWASPVLALVITVVIGIVLFAALGKDPVRGLQVFFWEPIKSTYALGELMRELAARGFRCMTDLSPGLRIARGEVDSRRVVPGGLFIALPGARTHGLEYASEAVTHGAVAVLCDVAQRELARELPAIFVDDVVRAGRLDDRGFERAFASGGGAPATIGRDAGGHLVVPAVALHHLVPGLRAVSSDGRERLIDYLVANFDELVYV